MTSFFLIGIVILLCIWHNNVSFGGCGILFKHTSVMRSYAYLEKEGYEIAGAPRAVYIDGIWNRENADKWLAIIQVPVEKA